MITTLPKEELAEALKGFRLLKRKKGANQAPLTIRVEPGVNSVRLSAFCLCHTLSYTLPTPEPHAPGEVLYLSDVHLEEAAKGADRRTGIAIDRAQNLIRYQTKGIDIEHSFQPVADAPPIEGDLAEGRDIYWAGVVMATIAQASVCASTDETRYILNGVHIKRGEIAATNGRKLYLSRTEPLPVPTEGITLPSHPVLKLFLGGGSAIFRLGPVPQAEHLNRRFQLSAGPWTWSASLVTGKYPNYHQVLPKKDQSRTEVDISRADAAKLIEVLPSLPRMKAPDSPIHLELKAGCLTVIAEAEGSHARVELESSLVSDEAEDLLVACNRTFLREALQQGFRRLLLRDELSPLSMEDPDRSRTFLWMPLRVPVPSPAVQPEEPATPATQTENAAESSRDSVHHNRLSPEAASAPTSPTTERKENAMHQNENENENEPEYEPANGNRLGHPAATPAHGSNGTNGTNGLNGHNRLNGNGSHPSQEEERDPLEQVLEEIQTVKEALRDNLARVNSLAPLVRQMARDHKTLEREHRSLRKNLRGLQALDV